MQYFKMMVRILIIIALCILTTDGAFEIQYTVTEESGQNVEVGSVGEDAGLNGEVGTIAEYLALRYSLLVNGNKDAEYFVINETTGHLYTSQSLDRDTICAFQKKECHLIFEIIAQSAMGSFFKVKVDVLLLDINDNSPSFDDDIVSLSISEATKINSSISLNGAQDPDFGSNSIQSYRIVSIDSPFEAKSDTSTDGRSVLRLIVKRALDRESIPSYMLQVLAFDGGNPRKSGSLTVNISLIDVNEFAPVFSKQTYNVTIYEDHPVARSILTVSALDPDGGINGEIKFSLSALQSAEILSRFSINESTGDMHLKTDLIDDSKDSYRIIVEASDSAKQPMLSQAQIFIKVIDNHNNAPKIDIDLLSDSPYAEVSEHASQGAAVALVAVTDRDTGANGLVTCNVLNENFRIQKYDNMEYKIVVFTSLNREIHEQYDVTVLCQDAATPPKSAFSTFTVLVLDENDNAPRFLQNNYHAHISENNAIGVTAVRVSATDIDKGDNAIIRYSLSPSNNEKFNINPITGVVYVNFRLDRETMEKYSFQVLAKDMGTPTLTGTAVVNIIVQDLNDNEPIFGQDNFQFYVHENQPPNYSVGRIQAIDLDSGENGRVVYSILPIPPHDEMSLPFMLSSGGHIRTSAPLDREQTSQYSFRLKVKDNGSPSFENTVVITVNVIDDNDNSPVFTFPTKMENSVSISYQITLNSIITTLQASDNDTGVNSKLTFFTNDKNISNIFLLNSLTGDIYLVKDLHLSDVGTYSFEVQVQDGGGASSRHSSQVLTIKITDEVLNTGTRRYAVIAICISVVTVFIAVILVFVIYLLRRYDQRKTEKFNKQIDESFSDKASDKVTQEDFEAGFGDSSRGSGSPVGSNSTLSCPPSYSIVTADELPRRPATIDRSISLQVSSGFVLFTEQFLLVKSLPSAVVCLKVKYEKL